MEKRKKNTHTHTHHMYLEVRAGLTAETAAVRVVGAAEGGFGDGDFSRPMVAVYGVPDDQALCLDVTVVDVQIAQ